MALGAFGFSSGFTLSAEHATVKAWQAFLFNSAVELSIGANAFSVLGGGDPFS